MADATRGGAAGRTPKPKPGGAARGGAAVARGGQGGRAAKPGSARKGAAIGSGGNNKRRLEGRGPTPKAEDRTGHPAARRAATAARRTPARGAPRRGRADAEVVVGRNPVVEALRAGVPAASLLVAAGLDRDARLVEAFTIASRIGMPVLEVSKVELDRLSDGALHQGVALRIPPYVYAHPDDLLRAAGDDPHEALLVALDGVTDPRNLGAVIRSAAAFGGHGVIVPERRAAGMTAAAWKTSAGAAARLPVARATNLVRVLRGAADAGLLVVGLAADAPLSLDDFDTAVDPLLLVVGSEGKGLGGLVTEACDLTISIPLAGPVESLNAGVAAGIALAEVARRRRQAGRL